MHKNKSEGFLTPRKQKVWTMGLLILLSIMLYSLKTIITSPYLLYLHLVITLILAWPIVIFDIINPSQVPFALQVIALLVYLYYTYVLSCIIYYKRNKGKLQKK